MALFPQIFGRIERHCSNTGERKVLQQLKRCLSDDYIVWHNIPIGDRQREPDFVILNPRRGVLVLEVKDWKFSTLLELDRDKITLQTEHGPTTCDHPDRQAMRYAREIHAVLERDPQLQQQGPLHRGRCIVPYGWGVALSGIRSRDAGAVTDFAEIFSPHKTLLADDLAESVHPDQFEERLWAMFVVAFPVTLTLPQQDRVRWHLFPDLRITMGTPSNSESGSGMLTIPDLIQVMDLQQETTARTLGTGHRIIHGPAGSGKTMVLIFRAQQLAAQAAPGSPPILVTCYNRPLADRLRQMLAERGVSPQRVQVQTFHQWCSEMVRSYQLPVPRGLSTSESLDEQVRVVERHLASGMVPQGQYSALLIDEAHDFDATWLRMAAQLVTPETKSLLILYDDAQAINRRAERRRFSFASVGIEAQGRTSIFKFNYRNTTEILAVALHLADSLLTEREENDDHVARIHPETAGRRGPVPVLIKARDGWEEARHIVDRIAAQLREGVPLDDIAILSTGYRLNAMEQCLTQRSIPWQRHRSGISRIDWSIPRVKLLGMSTSKGLEFPHVYVAHIDGLPERADQDTDDALRILYVAMTRATQTLTLSAAAITPLVQRVEQSVAAVRQEFGG